MRLQDLFLTVVRPALHAPDKYYQPLADNKQELRRVNELLSCTGRSQKEAKQQTVSMVICSTMFHYTVYWERYIDS